MKKSNKRLIATTLFVPKQARKLMHTQYYEATQKNMKDYKHIQMEKMRLSTPHTEYITHLIDVYKEMENDGWESPVAKALKGILKTNIETNKDLPTHNNLHKILGNPEILILAYKMIKGNKGAMTKGGEKSKEDLKKMNKEQLELYYKSKIFPDKISIEDFILAGKLIRQNKYPWGTSKRIYVPKPGSEKMRPITIPPFMDRIVQKAISMILESIYEAEFDSMNRSFGFRPGKGVHDAIIGIKSKLNIGKHIAIEGDIKAAYDTVDREILMKILNKRIKDNKFLNLIKERLKYDYTETNEKKETTRHKPEIGIPQGGINSPYLFNIYMMELDKFILRDLQEYLNTINKKIGKRVFNKENKKIKDQFRKFRRHVQSANLQLKASKTQEEIVKNKKNLYEKIKIFRLQRHYARKVSTATGNRKLITYYYTRYADDWILLIYGSMEIANKLKEKISNFLKEKLKLELSQEKTLITDITKKPAKFLGFEIRAYERSQLYKEKVKNQIRKYNLRRHGGLLIRVSVDRDRLINRFHMKGFCDKKGFPKEIRWLSALEPQIIIERFNSIIRRYAQYYLQFTNSNSSIHRWIYILRFSCMKTLAQKYKTTIKKLFKKY